MRYVNDYRNIADKANVEFVMQDDQSRGLLRVVLAAKTSIGKGDELLCDYGQDYWKTLEKEERKPLALTRKRKRPLDSAGTCISGRTLEDEETYSDTSSSEESEEDRSDEYFPF